MQLIFDNKEGEASAKHRFYPAVKNLTTNGRIDVSMPCNVTPNKVLKSGRYILRSFHETFQEIIMPKETTTFQTSNSNQISKNFTAKGAKQTKDASCSPRVECPSGTFFFSYSLSASR